MRILAKQLLHSDVLLRPQLPRHLIGGQQIVERIPHARVNGVAGAIADPRIDLVQVEIVGMAPAGISEERDVGQDLTGELALQADVEAVVDAGCEVLLIPVGGSSQVGVAAIFCA